MTTEQRGSVQDAQKHEEDGNMKNMWAPLGTDLPKTNQFAMNTGANRTRLWAVTGQDQSASQLHRIVLHLGGSG